MENSKNIVGIYCGGITFTILTFMISGMFFWQYFFISGIGFQSISCRAYFVLKVIPLPQYCVWESQGRWNRLRLILVHAVPAAGWASFSFKGNPRRSHNKVRVLHKLGSSVTGLQLYACCGDDKKVGLNLSQQIAYWSTHTQAIKHRRSNDTPDD